MGTFTAEQLAQGLNIASATADAWEPGGPWNAQANTLQMLTDARHQLDIARVLSEAFLAGTASHAQLSPQAEKINADLEALQRTTARPQPYRFAIERAK